MYIYILYQGIPFTATSLEYSPRQKLTLLVVTRVKTEHKTIGVDGGNLTSTVDEDVAIEVPKDAMPDGTKISMGVSNATTVFLDFENKIF